MTKSRRKFTAEQKAVIVRRHLKGKEPISTIAEELSIQPTQIHQWVAMALDQVERAFEKNAKSEKASKLAEAKINQLKEQRIKKLEEKLMYKNEVIAELMEENVKAKKANGDL
ncbi:Transposase [Pirellula sp. SH-Sr6A]|uniref:transposase n=1 Tax=Pirellula sp. SH-Sr6A TaxID=1632865 RepID=UPI00078E41A6|nr:transposase [Pirellula sp. SH-Sr6A]AMV34675.1 Transposase [Pirellula sp. SH-Sr6A]